MVYFTKPCRFTLLKTENMKIEKRNFAKNIDFFVNLR